MKHSKLVLTGLVALTACSGGRERTVAEDRVEEQPDLRLPDTLSPGDTSVVLSSRHEPAVSPAEEPVVKPGPGPATKPIPVRRRQRPAAAAPRPAPPAVDTTVKGYAPTQPADSSAAADSGATDTIATKSDTAAAPGGDTPAARGDSVTLAGRDTAPAPTRDTTRDTTVALAQDTASITAADTSTAAADTMVAPAPAATPTPTSSSAAAATRTLPVGTEIHAALDDSISSRHDTVGQTVSAHLMENVIGPDGKTLIPAGTPVRFTVTQLRSSRSKNSQGRFALRADGIALNGQLQPIKADVRPVPRELRGRGVTASDAAKVGGGAAAGAVLGRVIGGNTRGAVIGGVAGAAAGTVVATQTATRDVVVKAKTPVVFVLTAPLTAP